VTERTNIATTTLIPIILNTSIKT